MFHFPHRALDISINPCWIIGFFVLGLGFRYIVSPITSWGDRWVYQQVYGRHQNCVHTPPRKKKKARKNKKNKVPGCGPGCGHGYDPLQRSRYDKRNSNSNSNFKEPGFCSVYDSHPRLSKPSSNLTKPLYKHKDDQLSNPSSDRSSNKLSDRSSNRSSLVKRRSKLLNNKDNKISRAIRISWPDLLRKFR